MVPIIAAHSLSVLTAVVPCQIQLPTQYNYTAVHSTAICILQQFWHVILLPVSLHFMLFVTEYTKHVGQAASNMDRNGIFFPFIMARWYDACSPCFVHEKVGTNQNHNAKTSIGLFRV
jgi:hypothetical protein